MKDWKLFFILLALVLAFDAGVSVGIRSEQAHVASNGLTWEW